LVLETPRAQDAQGPLSRRDTLTLLLALTSSVALFAWMARWFVAGLVPFTGDLLHLHYPVRDFYADALAARHRIDWMPALFSGFYVVGEGQLAAYHPLHWLLYRFLPLHRAFAVEVLAAYPCLFAGTWVWLRRICPAPAAAFGAMLFTFCGFNLAHGVHPNMVSILAHLPWVFRAMDGAFLAGTPRQRARWCAAIGVLAGSQLLLGHPQAVWFAGMAAAAYAAFLVVSAPPPRRLAGVAVVLCGALLGLAVGATQVIATLYTVTRSVRSTFDASFSTEFSLPLLHLVQLVQPYALWGRVLRWNEVPAAGDESAVYGGALTLVLVTWWCAWAIGRRRRSGPLERFGAWALLLGVLGLWLAIGAGGGLYLAQTWLPIIRQFRAPTRYVMFAQLAFACVGALAMTVLVRDAPEDARARRRALWAPWGVAVLSMICTAALVLRPATATPPLATAPATWLGPMLFVSAAGLVTLAARGVSWAVPALVLFAAADHGLYGVGGIIAWQDFIAPKDVVPLLGPADRRPPPEAGRIFRGGFPDLYALGDYRLLDGYLAIPPIKRLHYDSLQTWRAAQVAYVHTDVYAAAKGSDSLLADRWYRVPDVPPRVRLVGQAIVSVHPETDIERVDHRRSALVERPLPLDGAAAGTVTVVRDEPGDLAVRTASGGQQLLVVSESYDDSWAATVDGQPAGVERVNGDFLGAVVPGGTHDVVLQFRPAHLVWGKGISLAGVFIVAVLAAVSVRRVRLMADTTPRM
jgi:hypothetical protein